MKPTMLAAPLTALVVLTGACGLLPAAKEPGDPVPSVSPSDGPGLTRVWRIPRKNAKLAATKAAGGIVVSGGLRADGESVFIDGTTGKITGQAKTADLTTADAHPVTDGQGHPLVAIDENRDTLPKESVYAPDGRLVWHWTVDTARYAGGYVAEPRKTGGVYRLVVHPPNGRAVARLPLPRYDPDPGGRFRFQVVRPGLLVVGGFGRDYAQVALLDVSRPGPARVTRLRPPFTASGADGPTGVQVGVGGAGHVYVSWAVAPIDGRRAPLARYDVPGPLPIWHRLAPAAAGGDPDVQVYPGGSDAVMITNSGQAPADTKFWSVSPSSGTTAGPLNGRAGFLQFVSGGRAYALTGDSADPGMNVVELTSGTTRKVDAIFAGATTNGYLIDDGGYSITAYRWE